MAGIMTANASAFSAASSAALLFGGLNAGPTSDIGLAALVVASGAFCGAFSVIFMIIFVADLAQASQSRTPPTAS